MSRPTSGVRGTAGLPSPVGAVTEPEYQQFRKGDKVRVAGRRGTRTFYGVTLTAAGNMWAVLYGTQFESCDVNDLVEV